MREAAINPWALSEPRNLFDLAAAMLGKNCSGFELEVACTRAPSVLVDQAFFGLDRRFEALLQQLDAPSVSDEGLKRLIAVQSPWAAPAIKKGKR